MFSGIGNAIFGGTHFLGHPSLRTFLMGAQLAPKQLCLHKIQRSGRRCPIVISASSRSGPSSESRSALSPAAGPGPEQPDVGMAAGPGGGGAGRHGRSPRELPARS